MSDGTRHGNYERSFVIRRATGDDAAELGELMGELGYPATTEQMTGRLEAINRESNYLTLIAEMDDEVIGMAGAFAGLAFESDEKYVRIIALVVKKAFRNRKAGKCLVEGIEDWATDQGIKKIAVNTGNRRGESHSFYERNGFEGSGIGYYKRL
ncbi:GNAT family N-acetyltransferase [Exiguobacterium flavidum]|uniref:GNAT family N-acetyltransferase n=1 Tax=Exiguobacterium flavidum TaxID=2184695 RepID=UPI0013003EF8|nr:GNAT family N-acetyltransferase [Exiguobacterium flavidum]